MQIRDLFEAKVRSAVKECYEIGYAPTRFESMIRKSHPVEVAKKFVVSGEFQYGFKELLKLGKSDLTIESIMLDESFKELFSSNELAAAEWRLKMGKH
ncbi:hypothetical protein AN394_04185 [Pseudoalteromonas sp. P1-26]|uniref:hypothetical protein n=1 Tax=Pseudoalteromonas sp. P1-26 TaxID=1723759 RepID=UPI0006D663CB|nr:hypothetical protein [Pseudoalteromonas sp. P1-26]KPZ65999.1 hypothetical protein AN394_04185 [Pseudoalteromonas sp. P1-26]